MSPSSLSKKGYISCCPALTDEKLSLSSIIGGLANAPFKGLRAWTEVLQDTFLKLFDSGKLDFATATSIRFSPEG